MLQHAQEHTTSERLLPADQVANAFSVSLATVRRLIRSGRLPSVRIGRCRRIPASALDRIGREGIASGGADV